MGPESPFSKKTRTCVQRGMLEICLGNACWFERIVVAASSHPLRTDLTAPQEQKDERPQQAYTHGAYFRKTIRHIFGLQRNKASQVKQLYYPSFIPFFFRVLSPPWFGKQKQNSIRRLAKIITSFVPVLFSVAGHITHTRERHRSSSQSISNQQQGKRLLSPLFPY